MSRVVAISVYKVKYSGERLRPFLKTGKPVTQFEILGNSHNFEAIGEFAHIVIRHGIGSRRIDDDDGSE